MKRGITTCNGVPCMRVEVGGMAFDAFASRYAVVDGAGVDHRGVWWQAIDAVPFMSTRVNAVERLPRLRRVPLYWYVPELRGVYPQVRAIPESVLSRESHQGGE